MNIASLESCPPKARILLWADLNYSDADEITKTESVPEISRILCKALKINAPEPQQDILLEMYTNIVLFCRQQKFRKEQTSVLLSIMKNVHQLNTETPLNNMDLCFTYCSELLLCHSVRRPPFSIDLFNSQQVTEILKYLINTYMRHYVLYKYVFTPQLSMISGHVAKLENETQHGPDSAIEQEMTSTQILPTETAVSEQDLSPKEMLRTIIQKEVKEEVMQLSGYLEKRLQESTDQLNTAFTALETRFQPKK